MSRVFLSVVLCCLLLCFASGYERIEGGKEEGDSCSLYGKMGTCTRITRCPHYSERRSDWWKIKICGFVEQESVICCVFSEVTTTTTTTTTTPKPVATTPKMGRGTTTYVPPTYDYVDNSDLKNRVALAPDGCAYLSNDVSTSPTGNKAWDKCLEYQLRLVYPCERSVALGGDMTRVNHCHHHAVPLIMGGENAAKDEFPHMVLLRYGRSGVRAKWHCGGSIISDRYILTAAHCTSTRGIPVNYAIVGSLNRTDNVNASKVYRIRRILKHKDYSPYTNHNDIALLETAKPIQLDSTVVPACLDVFGDAQEKVIATGWGRNASLGSSANTLQKVVLNKFSKEECSFKYPAGLYGGFLNSTIQICYGDHEKAADTCQGDSGGPLAVFNHRLDCMYTVVGITSFGKKCGLIGMPGVYTRVAHYVPWIESIVWP